MNSEQKLLTDYYEKEKTYQNAISFPFEIKPDEFMKPEDRLPEPFTIAVPKSKGEFSEGIMRWAQSYGFDYEDTSGKRLLFTNINGSRLFLERSSDILCYLQNGYVDYGILGAEKIFENQFPFAPYSPIQPLCFGQSYFCLGFKDDTYPTFSSPEGLVDYLILQASKGKSIATSLPKTLSKVLNDLQQQSGYGFTRSNFFLKDGSIENSIDLLPDMVCAIADIVESGDTSLANGIRADYRLVQIPGAFVVKFDFQLRQNYENSLPRSPWFMLQ
ncbi:MAG: hypothetical protein NUV98_01395 [Candidatus Roizmanbacteria bacterium]|nr:hypothetical protein [Candidatus Roizmanbacteria bacterium]